MKNTKAALKELANIGDFIAGQDDKEKRKMSDRNDFEQWKKEAILHGKSEITDMDWHMAWLGFRGARQMDRQNTCNIGYNFPCTPDCEEHGGCCISGTSS